MPITTLANSEMSSVLMNPELEQRVGATETTSKAAPVDDRHQPFCFSYRFSDAMLMAADVQTVGEYLDAHQGWFTRCAHPIKVNPIGQNGYALTIGKFNSCGYIVEPKIGLELLPPESGVYQFQCSDAAARVRKRAAIGNEDRLGSRFECLYSVSQVYL